MADNHGENFRDLLRNRRIIQEDFADKMEISRSYIQRMFTKEKFTEKTINKICSVLEKEYNYLVDKEVYFPMNENKNVPNGKQILGIQKDNCYIVPVKAFGGFLNGYENKVYMDTIQKASFPLIRGECFMFEIEGHSMIKAGDLEGSFLPGNWVVTTPIDDFSELRSHKVYVFQTVDGIIIKEYNKMESDCAHLSAYSGEPVTPIHLKSIKRVYFVDFKINKP